MSLSERIIQAVMNRMSAEEKERLLETAVDKFFQGMTAEEKRQFIEKLIRRLLEEVDMKEVFPQIIAMMWKEAGESDILERMTHVASHSGKKISEFVADRFSS